jgi:hypothetical protein
MNEVSKQRPGLIEMLPGIMLDVLRWEEMSSQHNPCSAILAKDATEYKLRVLPLQQTNSCFLNVIGNRNRETNVTHNKIYNTYTP